MAFDPDALHARLDLLQQRLTMFGLTLDRSYLAADEFYFAELNPKPHSEVSGAAVFALDRDTSQLTVAVFAEGLEAGRPHIQHIHGFADGRDAVEPTIAADVDGDGYIEGVEGAPFWGPVMLDMPTVTTPDGDEFFVQHFQLPRQALGAEPHLNLREYNIHGMTVPDGAGAGTPNEINGTGGYKAGLVVTGGDIEPIGSAGELRDFLQQSDFADAARQALHDRFAAMASGWIV